MRIYRASSLGYSLCQLVCGHLGYEAASPPEWLQEKYDEGNRLEPMIIEGIKNDQNVKDEQLEVELEIIPDKVKVVGHIDGMVDESGWRLLEIKTMAHAMFERVEDKGWDAGGIMEKYKWQVSAYQLATGLPLTLCVWDKQEKDWCFIRTDKPFYSVADIANKLAEAEEHIANGIIPDGCSDYPCPYYYLHEQKDAKEVVNADDELEAVLAAWYEADKNAKIYEAEKKVLREQIIELIEEGDLAAPVIRASNGVKVETYWQEGKEYMVKQTSKWVTKVTGPRGKSGV